MSQKSLNDLLRSEDKAGWIEKKREGMGCGIKELEASWNRNVERYKKTLPSEKTQLKTLLNRAIAEPRKTLYQNSRVYKKKGTNKKSPLRNESHLSTNALTRQQQQSLADESMGQSLRVNNRGGGKRKRKTRKRKRRRTKKKRRKNRRKSKKNKRKSKRRR